MFLAGMSFLCKFSQTLKRFSTEAIWQFLYSMLFMCPINFENVTEKLKMFYSDKLDTSLTKFDLILTI